MQHVFEVKFAGRGSPWVLNAPSQVRDRSPMTTGCSAGLAACSRGCRDSCVGVLRASMFVIRVLILAVVQKAVGEEKHAQRNRHSDI